MEHCDFWDKQTSFIVKYNMWEDTPKTFNFRLGELLPSKTYDWVGNRLMMFVSAWLRTTWICKKICCLHLDSPKKMLGKKFQTYSAKIGGGWFKNGDLIHGKIIRKTSSSTISTNPSHGTWKKTPHTPRSEAPGGPKKSLVWMNLRTERLGRTGGSKEGGQWKGQLQSMNLNVYTWVFPKMGSFPPHIIHFNMGFPLFSPSILFFFFYFWKHPTLIFATTSDEVVQQGKCHCHIK